MSLSNNVVYRIEPKGFPNHFFAINGNGPTDKVELQNINTSSWQTRDKSEFIARELSPGVFALESLLYQGTNTYLYPTTIGGRGCLGVKTGNPATDADLRFNVTPASDPTSGPEYFGLKGVMGSPRWISADANGVILKNSAPSRYLNHFDFKAIPTMAYRWQGANCENVRSSMEIDTQIIDNESFTIELWIHPTAGALPYFFSILGSNGVTNAIDLGMNGAGRLTFFYTFGPQYQDRYHQEIGVIPSNQWSHLSLTMENNADGQGNPLRFSINGVQQAVNNPQLLRGFPQDTILDIKQLGGGSQLPVCAQMTEFRLWKTARTADQVRDLMNKRVPDTQLADLQAYFPLNGDLKDHALTRSNYTAPSNNLTLITNAHVPF